MDQRVRRSPDEENRDNVSIVGRGMDNVVPESIRLPFLSWLQLREREILRRQIRPVLCPGIHARGEYVGGGSADLRVQGHIQVFRARVAPQFRIHSRKDGRPV